MGARKSAPRSWCCQRSGATSPSPPSRIKRALNRCRAGMTRHATGVDMIKLILAIAAAAACAGIVVLAPELGPNSAIAATQSGESGAVTQNFVVAEAKQQPDGGCLQHWPYYE